MIKKLFYNGIEYKRVFWNGVKVINRLFKPVFELIIYGKSIQKQSTQGKNLFDKNKLFHTNSAGAEIDGDWIIANNNTGGSQRFTMRLVEGKTYTFSAIGKTDGMLGQRQYQLLHTKELISGAVPASFIANVDYITTGGLTWGTSTTTIDTETKLTKAFTVPAGFPYVLAYLIAQNGKVSVKEIQLEEGGNATTYEPFVPNMPSPEYPSPIESVTSPRITACGKNLIDLDELAGFYNGKPGYVVTKEGDRWKIAATGSATALNYERLKFKPNTRYTLSALMENGTAIDAWHTCILVVYTDGTNGGVLNPHYADRVEKYVTLTTAAGKSVSHLKVYSANGASYFSYIKNLQIEESTTATAYEPYQGSTAFLNGTTLRSLPDGTKDEVLKKEGEWGVVRRIDEFNVARLGINNSTAIGCFINRDNTPAFVYAKTGTKPYCTHLPYGNSGTNPHIWLYTDRLYANYLPASTFGIMPEDDIPARQTKINTWLTNNPMRVAYALQTEVWEPLTGAQQDELSEMCSKKGIVHVFTDSPLNPDISMTIIPENTKTFTLNGEELDEAILPEEDSIISKVISIENNGDADITVQFRKPGKKSGITVEEFDVLSGTIWDDGYDEQELSRIVLYSELFTGSVTVKWEESTE